MKRGIYIMANDRVIDQSIALMNSIRFYDPEVPVVLIPYDSHFRFLGRILEQYYGVSIYEHLEQLDSMSAKLNDMFGVDFFTRPNQFRKQVCWFGPFDEFLYIDTDIVVFEKIISTLNCLLAYDFMCCDYQHSGGIADIFTQELITDDVLSESALIDVFNGGFWGSKKGLINEEQLYKIFAQCAKHVHYFDFSRRVSDQPVINYLVLKNLPKRINLARDPAKGPGSWAGSDHFQRKDNSLLDPHVNQRLRYLHWAGIKIEEGCPYWDIWKYYRDLGGPKLGKVSSVEEKKPSLLSKAFNLFGR